MLSTFYITFIQLSLPLSFLRSLQNMDFLHNLRCFVCVFVRTNKIGWLNVSSHITVWLRHNLWMTTSQCAELHTHRSQSIFHSNVTQNYATHQSPQCGKKTQTRLLMCRAKHLLTFWRFDHSSGFRFLLPVKLADLLNLILSRILSALRILYGPFQTIIGCFCIQYSIGQN